MKIFLETFSLKINLIADTFSYTVYIFLQCHIKTSAIQGSGIGSLSLELFLEKTSSHVVFARSVHSVNIDWTPESVAYLGGQQTIAHKKRMREREGERGGVGVRESGERVEEREGDKLTLHYIYNSVLLSHPNFSYTLYIF